MPYYCPDHKVACLEARQFDGHWLGAHKGTTKPSAEEFQVDEVPEGATMMESKKPKAPPVLTPVGQSREERVAPSHHNTPPDEIPLADDAARLDRMLAGIGCPQDKRQTIVGGVTVFPMLLQHPANLANHLAAHLPANLKPMQTLLVYQFFQDQGDPDSAVPDSPMWYPPRGAPTRSGSQPFWLHSPQWGNPQAARWGPDFGGWDDSPERRGREEEAQEDPRVKALSDKLDAALKVQEEERAERRREEAERKEREREAAQAANLKTLKDSFTAQIDQIMEKLQKLQEASQNGRTSAEQSDLKDVRERLAAVSSQLEDQKTARLQDSIDSVKGLVTSLQARIDQGPGGKTTEDLIGAALPSVMDRIEEVGATVKEEMGGLRKAVQAGQMPVLVAPSPLAAPAAAPAVEAAQKMAAVRALDEKVLALTNQ